MIPFPIFENIENKTFLFVGGGKVAKNKVKRLLLFTDQIIIVSKITEIQGTVIATEGRSREEIKADLANTKGVRILQKPFELEDLELGDFVIGATDDRALNQKVHQGCVERKLPVNIADDDELCTFMFPGFIRKGDLTIAVSTGGKSPAAAKFLRKKIESELPENIEEIIGRLGELRKVAPKRISTQKERRGFYREVLKRLIETDNGLTDDEIEEILVSHEG